MNITAKELSGEHIGKKIKLGETYATIKEIKAGTRTVEVRAGVAPSSIGPEVHFLSIPIDSTVTIQDEAKPEPLDVKGNAVITSRFDHFGSLPNSSAETQPSNDRLIQFSKATRIELIRNGKRDTIKYGEPGVQIYLQDNSRTLKIHYKEEQ